MHAFRLLATIAPLVLAGCVAHTHPESAALTMPWPKSPDLLSAASASADFPSVGGDILKGASPEDQAAIRKSAGQSPKSR